MYTSQHFTITEGKKGEQNCLSKMFLASKYNSVRNLLTALHKKRQKRAKAKQETERFGVNLCCCYSLFCFRIGAHVFSYALTFCANLFV